MTTAREGYDEQWKNYRSSGPHDWRRVYHAQPDDRFVALCDLAHARGYTVELVAGSQRLGPVGAEHRDLKGLYVGKSRETPVVTVAIGQGEPLRTVATRALEKLEAIA